MSARWTRVRRTLARYAAAALPAIWAAPAFGSPVMTADSDGYYCIGPDYLAWQFAFSNRVTGHQLQVVPLSRGLAIDEPAVLPLPAFQVYGMRCNETSVELRDRDTVYGVDISDRRHPVLIGRKPLDPGTAYRFHQANLGLWAFAGFQSNGAAALTVPLPSPGAHLRAALILRVNETNGATRRHQAEIVIVNERTGRLNSRAIFEGTSRAGAD